MRMWQQAMIFLARSGRVTRLMEGSRLMNSFSGQFVCGRDQKTAVTSLRRLKKSGINASLFYLGEYVEEQSVVLENVDALCEGISALAEGGLDVHVSVDPTQVGSMISWDECREHVRSLASRVRDQAAEGRRVLMLDMEDSSVIQSTLDLYHYLKDEDLPAAVTVQAYLHRTPQDLKRLVSRGAMVRLVKGAFAEGPDRAVIGRAAIDRAYEDSLRTLFSPDARDAGVYPVLGTHDHRMVRFAVGLARENGWSNDMWEVEMLYGVRPEYQRELIAQGCSLRLYAPFGCGWWPYSIRRVGESPRNLWFVLRSLVGV